ncbi:hypothetical protein Taro_049014, partial [Colocasia esculenta]|nr:hypothetical protein [Colocasia esculenta]
RPGGIQGVVPFGCEGRPGGIQGVVPFECEGRPAELGVVASLGGLYPKRTSACSFHRRGRTTHGHALPVSCREGSACLCLLLHLASRDSAERPSSNNSSESSSPWRRGPCIALASAGETPSPLDDRARTATMQYGCCTYVFSGAGTSHLVHPTSKMGTGAIYISIVMLGSRAQLSWRGRAPPHARRVEGAGPSNIKCVFCFFTICAHK